MFFFPTRRRPFFRQRDAIDGIEFEVQTGYCFDAGNGPPILYPCHEPKAQRKQRFQIVDSPGWVQFMRGWEA